ncbi:MAG: hypothetical protein ACYDDS_01385 [Candidatus Sulfotelmatobacter sp.]
MSVRNVTALLIALSTLLFLAACGSGASVTKPIPPPSGAFSDSNLNGTYVFSVSGTDLNNAALAVVGTFTANGSGGITGGTVDINDGEVTPAPNLSISGSGSSYNVSVDGRGRATLAISGSPLPNNLILDFVLSSSSHGLVIELDSNASGSGTLDLQSAGVTPVGSYAFSLSGGTPGTSPSPWATVGNFTLSGATISGTDDFNESGLIPFPAQSLTGNLILGPSASPSTTLTTAGFNTLTFDAFAIDATHLKFIEMDSTAILSGDAFSQPSTAMPNGTLAFTMIGLTSADVPFASGGFMTTSGANITGTEDYTDGNTDSQQSTPAPFTASFAAGGTGRFTLGNFGTFVGGSSYAAYPSSGGLLLLEIDSAGITTGAAYTQTSPLPTLASAQGYGLNLSGINLGATTGFPSEVDDIAEFTASSGTLTAGIIDENSPGLPNPLFDLGLTSGTYGTIDTLGRYGLSAIAGNNNESTLNGGFALTLYTVDGTTFPFIEMDGGQIATGVMVLQNPSEANAASAHAQMFTPQPMIHTHTNRQKKN